MAVARTKARTKESGYVGVAGGSVVVGAARVGVLFSGCEGRVFLQGGNQLDLSVPQLDSEGLACSGVEAEGEIGHCSGGGE